MELHPSPDEPPQDITALDDAAWQARLSRFGHTAFRPGQREAIRALMQHRRLLLVAPTGGGKSLTYQLPAHLLPGTTLVISPLISLMQDQVDALQACGVPATFLASTLEGDEMTRRMSDLARGSFDLAYVAPERLSFAGFRSLLRDLNCPLVAVDEAHCISEWGHDFRPDYMQIGEILQALPGARTLACTATATPVVRDEILLRLGLPADTPQIVRGFARPNLSLRFAEVASGQQRHRRLDAALAEALGQPGAGRGAAIVYGPTRRKVEEEAQRLQGQGWHCRAYHAGMPGPEREAVHRAFSGGEAEVVVATNAFGMGIDRADVRAVLHMAPPGSLEAWYQEVGRAGRDGDPALGLTLIASQDLPLRRRLIEMPVNGVPPGEESVRHKWNLFLELLRLAEGGSCRHDAVLRYFGDEAETLAGCGRCDVCTGDVPDSGFSDEETTTVVRKALSAVARINGRFGLQMVVGLLRGRKDERLARSGLDRTPTHGILQEHSDDWLTRLLRRCITAGYVTFQGDDRPVVVLTGSGAAVMKGERPVRLQMPPLRSGSGSPSPTPTSGRRRPQPDAELADRDAGLFEDLRSLRLELARAAGVPPYVVATDRALRDIARLRPQTGEALLLCHGIGEAKAERYGSQLLAVVRARQETGPA